MDDLPADCFLQTEEREEVSQHGHGKEGREGVQDQHHTNTSKEHDDPAHRLSMCQLTKPSV